MITTTTPTVDEVFSQGQAVNAGYACGDEAGGSGLAPCVGDLANGAAIDTSTLGAFSFTETGIDNQGNSTIVTHDYTVVVVDVTGPVVTLTTPAVDEVFSQGQSVNAGYACSDEAGGSGLASCVGDLANGAAIGTSTLGAFSFTVTGIDNQGNSTIVTHDYTVVVVDVTGPVVTLTTPAVDEVFSQGQAVNADYACSDEAGGSGLASCVGDLANGAAIDTSTLGAFSFTVTGIDNQGNSTIITHDYTVVDVTDPVITLTTPAVDEVFSQGQAVNAGYACSDEAGGSGLASCVGDLANGAAIGTSTLGAFSFTVTGIDNQGNSTIVTHDYTVVEVIDPGTARAAVEAIIFELSQLEPQSKRLEKAIKELNKSLEDKLWLDEFPDP